MAPQVKEAPGDAGGFQDIPNKVGKLPHREEATGSAEALRLPEMGEDDKPMAPPKVWWINLVFMTLIHLVGLATLILDDVTFAKLFLVFLVWLPAGSCKLEFHRLMKPYRFTATLDLPLD